MSVEKYEYQPLSEDRLDAVQFLFKEVFRKRVSREYLRMKYDTKWCGARHLCYLAYMGGEPVAFYGAIPQEFVCGEDVFLAAHTCDSITLPAHQRKGLHKALAIRTYELMQENGIRFVYAYHSENTYHSCKKLDWKEGPRMRGVWVPTGGLPFAKIARRMPLLGQIYRTRQNKTLASFPQEPYQLISTPEAAMRVHYRPEFFHYKQFSSNAIIELAGAIFWIKIDAVIHVGDVQFGSDNELEAGIEALRKLGRRMGLSQILFQTSPSSALNIYLEAHYFPFDSWQVGYLDFEEGIPFKNWEMRFGDLDTF